MPRGVGLLSIYSKSDGIVKWQACLDPSAAQFEIESSHIGMAVNPDGYRAIAETLAVFRGARRQSQRQSQRARRLRAA
jgi:hypothetical protein